MGALSLGEGWRAVAPPVNFSLSKNYLLVVKFCRKGIFALKFRKPGWTVQSKVVYGGSLYRHTAWVNWDQPLSLTHWPMTWPDQNCWPGDPETRFHLWTIHNEHVQTHYDQITQEETHAIAKITTRCALYMDALKIFGSPRLQSRLHFQKLLMGICCNRSY